MIIAVDFDRCLSIGAYYPLCGTPNRPLVRALVQLHELGHTIILWTCREGEDLKAAVDWCIDNNIPIDYVNENPPWSGSTSRKIYADYYIDDKSVDAYDNETIVKLVHQALEEKYGRNWLQ